MRSLFSTKKPSGNFKWGSIGCSIHCILIYQGVVKTNSCGNIVRKHLIYMFFWNSPKNCKFSTQAISASGLLEQSYVFTVSHSALDVRVVSSVKWSLYKTVTTKFCSLYVSQLSYHHPVFVSHLSLFWISTLAIYFTNISIIFFSFFLIVEQRRNTVIRKFWICQIKYYRSIWGKLYI